ncbi:type II toxin-antitoxin system VapC family toxin [Nonomuraea sp. B19D2]|uniref:type II toxin-antitoxin system VapC family toxin n=1 Tax=Nonomuraea sp. B19D2 TaxID=3159561 RepID=UPI0032DA42E6
MPGKKLWQGTALPVSLLPAFAATVLVPLPNSALRPIFAMLPTPPMIPMMSDMSSFSSTAPSPQWTGSFRQSSWYPFRPVRKLPEDEALRALELLGRMNIRRYDHVSLLPRIWELRHNMWAYDASYVALAESLNAVLVTVDGKFTGAPGLRCRIRNLRIGQ